MTFKLAVVSLFVVIGSFIVVKEVMREKAETELMVLCGHYQNESEKEIKREIERLEAIGDFAASTLAVFLVLFVTSLLMWLFE